MLKSGLIIAMSVFVLNAGAESTGGPSSRLMDWKEFSELTIESQQAYLERVEAAIERFESRFNETMQNEEISLLMQLRELYAQHMSLISEADAETAKASSSGKGLNAVTTPRAQGKTTPKPAPLPPGPRPTNLKSPADSARPKPRSDVKAVEKGRALAQQSQPKPSGSGKEAKCPDLDPDDFEMARSNYRSNNKGAGCLVGGIGSNYAKGKNSCQLKTTIAVGGKEFKCSAKNIYKTGGGLAGSSTRATFCNPSLYCVKGAKSSNSAEPFCVQASSNILRTCKSVVSSDPKKFAFGADCLSGEKKKNAKEEYDRLEKEIDTICSVKNQEASAGLLCRDCSNLDNDLQAAKLAHKMSDDYEAIGGGTQ